MIDEKWGLLARLQKHGWYKIGQSANRTTSRGESRKSRVRTRVSRATAMYLLGGSRSETLTDFSTVRQVAGIRSNRVGRSSDGKV